MCPLLTPSSPCDAACLCCAQPPDCTGEDLSFLLDSKAPAQPQYLTEGGFPEPPKALQPYDSKGKSTHRKKMEKKTYSTLQNKPWFLTFDLSPPVSTSDSGLFQLDSFQEFNWWASYPQGEPLTRTVLQGDPSRTEGSVRCFLSSD